MRVSLGAKLISCLCVAAATFGDGLPNVVMIMADDWGWSDIAAYRRYQGLSDPIPTPNLDRMVANGMMFTDAHSPAALCAPTRFSMMTGSNPYRNGRQWGTWGFTQTSAFKSNRNHVTVGEIAKTAGYRTAFLGKMHLGGGVEDYEQVMPDFPATYGFDYVFTTHGGIQDPPYLYFENDRFARIDPADPLNPSAPGGNSNLVNWASGDYVGVNGTSNIQNDHTGIGDAYWDSSQNGIINSKKAAAFIGDAVANHSSQPFMMYYCPPQVHLPHTPPIDFDPNPDGTPGAPPNQPVLGVTGGTAVADMLHELDLQVGRILAALEDPNGDGDFADSVLGDTLIMFTSDNGGLGKDRGIGDYDSTGVLRGWKASSYEGGHRVPFVAMWPGTIASNSVSDQLICGHDWVGTMYALTTNSMPADQAMDCVNLLPTLLGERPENEPLREFMILQGHNANSSDNSYIMRQGDYVLLMNDDRDPVELYDLAMDFTQETNLIAEASEQTRVAEMEALFKAHDQKNEPRSTPAYVAPDVQPPLPNPAAFAADPVANGVAAISMTAVVASDFSGPVEYRFIETSGREGADSSAWSTSPTYVDDGLLPGVTYAYAVETRDALGHVSQASAVVEVLTPTNNVLLAENFETGNDAGNVSAPPYPVGVWHHQGTNDWALDGQSGDTSAHVGDYNGAPGREFRMGWGYDEVVSLLSTAAEIDTNQTYVLRGAWEIGNVLDVPRGFIAGFAEFSAADAALVRRLTPDTLVFGETNAPSVGASGTFEVALDTFSGVTPGNRLGVFFHHDDGGDLYDESHPLRNDVYYIDDVTIEGGRITMLEQWLINHQAGSPDDDADADGASNFAEFALGGDPRNPADQGFAVSLHVVSNSAYFTHPARLNASARYVVEVSEDLTSNLWVEAASAMLPERGRFSPDFEAVTNAIPTDAPKRYMRLRVEE